MKNEGKGNGFSNMTPDAARDLYRRHDGATEEPLEYLRERYNKSEKEQKKDQ